MDVESFRDHNTNMHTADESTGATPRLSIIIPIYNEIRTLAEILRRVRAVPISKEIILIDDGSSDGTTELLRSMNEDADVRVLFHAVNQGKGAALRTGFMHARGDIVLIQDADLEYHPADYPRLIAPIESGDADVVFGTRFPAHVRRLSLHALGNRLVTALSNIFTGLHLTDMETCYKLFRREIIQSIAPALEQTGFGIEPELAARIARGGWRVREVEVGYVGRSYHEGKKIGWRDALHAVWCIVRY